MTGPRAPAAAADWLSRSPQPRAADGRRHIVVSRIRAVRDMPSWDRRMAVRAPGTATGTDADLHTESARMRRLRTDRRPTYRPLLAMLTRNCRMAAVAESLSRSPCFRLREFSADTDTAQASCWTSLPSNHDLRGPHVARQHQL